MHGRRIHKRWCCRAGVQASQGSQCLRDISCACTGVNVQVSTRLSLMVSGEIPEMQTAFCFWQMASTIVRMRPGGQQILEFVEPQPSPLPS